MTQKIDYINHDVYDYYYQVEPSGDTWEYDEFEQYIWEDLEDEFDEWINEKYKTPADLLKALQKTITGCTTIGRHFDVNEWYWEQIYDFESYVLDNLDKFGIYHTLKEEDEEGE